MLLAAVTLVITFPATVALVITFAVCADDKLCEWLPDSAVNISDDAELLTCIPVFKETPSVVAVAPLVSVGVYFNDLIALSCVPPLT